jgi:acetolactate synthase-1/2/3 large subunit
MARAAEIKGPVLIDVVSDIDAVAPKGSAVRAPQGANQINGEGNR